MVLFGARAEICVADVDMSGTWHVGIAPGAFAVLDITQSGTELDIQAQSPGTGLSITGTIDPMTGDFTMTFIIDPPILCGAVFDGQLTGDTFIAPGTAYTTDPSCQSFSCACGVASPSELRGSRSPCGDGTVDVGETCDDGKLGFQGSCCALGCTPAPVGQACASDGNLCTDDVCDAGATCTHPPLSDGTNCADGQFCNGEETVCQGGVCATGTAPCPLACNEGTDQCVAACPASPQSCRAAEKSLLSLTIRSDPNRHRLRWKWTRGSATSQLEFSDPTLGTDYALCIYNGSATPQEVIIPAGAGAWTQLGASGYKYDDPSGAAGGIERVLLKGNALDKSKILTRGRGSTTPLIALPTAAPVTVQLYNGSTGLCWGADYSVTQMIKNEVDHLKAKAP